MNASELSLEENDEVLSEALKNQLGELVNRLTSSVRMVVVTELDFMERRWAKLEIITGARTLRLTPNEQGTLETLVYERVDQPGTRLFSLWLGFLYKLDWFLAPLGWMVPWSRGWT
jgi:hypothetical protein